MANTLRYNNAIPGNIYYNNAKVQNVYYNNTKVWSASPLSGTLSVGNTVTFDNRIWRVVHNNGNKWYLGLETMIETCLFYRADSYGDYGMFYDYRHGSIISDIRQKCLNYINTFSNVAQNMIVPTTLSRVAYDYDPNGYYDLNDKVFIPSYEMIKTDFSWYVNEGHRACTLNGTPYTWWLSSSVGKEPRYIQTSGSVYNSRDKATAYHGFRPHICIQV